MPITTETAPFFTHAFFIPQGLAFTSPAPGTASATSKPDADEAGWATGTLGDIEEFKITPAAETFEKMAGRPGTLVRVDEIVLSQKLDLSWKTTDITPLVHQLVFGTLALTGASNQGNPLEGSLLVKGWLKFQAYNAANRKVTGDLWVSMRAKAVDPWSGKNIHQVEFEVMNLHSTLGTLKFE